MVPLESLVAIGTLDEAETAAMIAEDMSNLELADVKGDCTSLPTYAYAAGWNCAGLGTTRLVLLSPSMVAYKIVRTDKSWNCSTTNHEEWENRFRCYVEHPEFRLADCTMWETEFGGVLAMEYIHDDSYPFSKERTDAGIFFVEHCRAKGIKLADIGGQNVKFDRSTNQYVIIDYAY